MSFLRDEKGKLSAARVLLTATLVFAFGVIYRDAADPGFRVALEAWGLLAGLLIALVAWAAGPRGLEYLGPQVSKLATAVTARLRGTDREGDDER